MTLKRIMVGLAMPLALAASPGVARAADAPAGATTMIDTAGEVVNGDLAGGIADPVPLFSDSTGPVLFVMTPAAEETPPSGRPHAAPKGMTLTTTRIGQR